MQKKVMQFNILLVGLLLMVTAVSADQTQYEMGPYVSWIRYREPGIMEEKGVMAGLFGSVTSRSGVGPQGLWPNMGRWEGQIGFGRVDYTSQNTGTIDNIDDMMFEGRYLAGYDFYPFGDLRLTPFLGLGYRYLRDDSSGLTSTTGHLGYKRESNYVYFPFGLDFQTSLSNDWTLGAAVEMDVLLYGRQKSHLGDADPGFGTLENEQTQGFGVRGSVRLVRLAERYHLLIEPFVRWWDIYESDLSVISCGGGSCILGYEPDNNSLESGIKIGVQF